MQHILAEVEKKEWGVGVGGKRREERRGSERVKDRLRVRGWGD